MRRWLLLLFCFLPVSALAQIGVWPEPVLDQNGKPVANASVAVCNNIPTFVFPCGGTTQVTLFSSFSGGAVPGNIVFTDQFGRAPIYAAAGNYYQQVVKAGFVPTITPITIGVATSSSNILPNNNTFTGINTFTNNVAITNAGVFDNSAMHDYISSIINGCNPQSEYDLVQGNVNPLTNAGDYCIAVPIGATNAQPNAVAAFLTNASSRPAVAVYGQARIAALNAHVWGGNLIAADAPGTFSTNQMIGLEIDIDNQHISSVGQGLLFQGTVQAANTGIEGIVFGKPATGFWNKGLHFQNLSVHTGIAFDTGATAAPSGSNAGISFNPVASGASQVSQGITFVATDGSSVQQVATLNMRPDGNMQISGTVLNTGLVAPNVNLGGIGPGTVNNRCQVDGITHANIAACMGLQGGTTGYRSQVVESSIPEVISVNPAPSNYSIELYLGPGIKSLNCDSTNPNCWVLEVPLILTSGSTIKGTGTVTVGNAGPGDMSGGTVIATGNNWPPPLGVPTVSAPTCGAAGGSLTNGNYFITIRTANNLQTNGGTAVAGPSMHTSEFTVNCANGGATQSISVTSPSAVGNAPFNAKDFQVAASTITGQEQIQARDTTNMACTAGIVSTFNGVNYGCLMGATATIKTIQTATRFFQDTDHSNDAIIIVPNQTVGFGVQMYGFTFSCGPVNSVNSFNMPNWAIWNQAGEELTGLTPSGLNLTAGCGGYSTGTPATGGSATGFSGGYIYQDTHTPNSVLEHMALGGGATTASVTAPFYSIYLDGRFDSSGSAAGVPRTVNDITVTPKSGNDVGHTPAYSLAAIYVTGARAKVHFSNIHIETTVPTTGDGIQCDNGAYCLFDGIEGQNATVGILIHCTATAGFCGGYGLCAIGTANSGQNKCAGQGQTGAAATFKDDNAGGQKLLGFVGHFSSIVANFKFVGLAPMTFTNLSTIYPCAAGTEGYEGSVTDDNTALAFNATITGGGTNHVHAFCNGTNWVMQ